MKPSGIIDVHTHIFDDAAYDAYMAKADGRVSEIITVQYWAANSQPRYPIEHLVDFAYRKGMAVIAAVNAHFAIEEQLDKIAELGKFIRGVKLYTGYQHFYPTDVIAKVVAEACQELEMPLMFHCGSLSARGRPLLKYAHPIHIDELAGKYPKCTFIIAHFGFPYLMDAAAVMSKNPNVYADISSTIDKCPSEWDKKRLIARYKDDLSRVVDYFPDIKGRILFGTDFSGEHTHLSEVEPYMDVVESVFTNPAEKESVYSGAAEKLFF